MTHDELIAAMRKRYAVPEWALFLEVGSGTGSNYRRSADAMAMSCFPSRGLHLHGFEIKSSRSDWLRELKKPEKAEAIFGFCDFWWLVVTDRAMVKEDELPAPWGLLAPNKAGDALAVVKQAPILQPKPISRTFMAAVLRNAAKSSATEAALEAARREGHEQGKKESDLNRNWTQERHVEMLKKIAQFEQASGVSIDHSWSLGQVGKAVQAIVAGPAELQRDCTHAANILRTALKSVEEAATALANSPGLQAVSDEVKKEAAMSVGEPKE